MCYQMFYLGVIHKGRPHGGGEGVWSNADKSGRGLATADVRNFFCSCVRYLVTKIVMKLLAEYITARNMLTEVFEVQAIDR